MLFARYLVFSIIIFSTGTADDNKHDPGCYPNFPIRDGLLCYPKCKQGYSNYGEGPICWGICPRETVDIGIACQKNTYGRGVGSPLTVCPNDTERNWALCYPLCKPDYYGVGPVCWEYCKNGYRDDGALCRQPLLLYGRDVGNCPWYDKCGLCGGPWYNVCGNRRKCGGECKDGYINDGCTCRRPLVVYAKNSYGRGVGEVLSCAPGMEQSGALCYPKCKPGYYGIGPVCWKRCGGETHDTGAYCQKNSYGRGVGRILSCLFISKANAKKVDISKITNYMQRSKQTNLTRDVCLGLWAVSKPVMTVLHYFGACEKQKAWNTMVFSISGSSSTLLTSGTEIGLAFDVEKNEAVCYVQQCSGFSSDVMSGGIAVNFGWFRSLDDIPGKWTVVYQSLRIPFMGIEISFAEIINSKADFIGAISSLGLGAGLSPLPFNIGRVTCNTPMNKIIYVTT